jgi:hypothetical protein
METLENRLQKRIHVSLYALVFLTLLLGLSVLLEGCTDRCESKQQYIYFEPVYTSLAELRGGVELTGPQPVQAVGKLYLKDGYLFINEPGEGIHIIDNANPAAPVQRGFLKIPGTYDLAIKGNTLYADSYIDLVLVDLTDPLNPRETGRLENVFSQYNSFGLGVTEHGIITDWVAIRRCNLGEVFCTNAGLLSQMFPTLTRAQLSLRGTALAPEWAARWHALPLTKITFIHWMREIYRRLISGRNSHRLLKTKCI